MTSSQLKAAYEGTAVNDTGGSLRRLLETSVNAEDFVESDQVRDQVQYSDMYEDTLQPMIITPNDVTRFRNELKNERSKNETQQINQNTKRGQLNFKRLYKLFAKKSILKIGTGKMGF